MTDLRVELKVCEGCGALWLRAGTEGTRDGVYCDGCRKRLAEYPAPKGRRTAYRAGRRTATVDRAARQRESHGLERGRLHRAQAEPLRARTISTAGGAR